MRMFGTGELWGTNLVVNSSPMKFGVVQDLSFEYSFTEKELRGQWQMPIAIARGAGKILGKAKLAKIDVAMYNSLFWGLSIAAVQQQIVKETSNIPASPGPYTIAGVAGATVLCVEDIGVIDVNGNRFIKVASAPATGQYSVAIGATTGITYTFAAADASKQATITYRYNPASGYDTLVLTNQLMGVAPFFAVNYLGSYDSGSLMLHLNKCTSNKLSLPLKLEDFLIAEFDFMVLDDGTGNIGSISNNTTL